MTEYKLIETADASHTLYSAAYDENYHSRIGALAESETKFIAPCRIGELARRGALTILDIGFGLGYNTLAALQEVQKSSPNARLRIVSLEKDLIDSTNWERLGLAEKFGSDIEPIRRLISEQSYRDERFDLKIDTGDARATIQKLEDEFDAVFFDPFSVKKNPELWSRDFFAAVKKLMSPTAILATYSAATPVRSALLECGFRVGPGPGDSLKKGGTLATIAGELSELVARERERLSRSPERCSYRDPRLNWSREDIMLYREELKRKDSAQS